MIRFAYPNVETSGEKVKFVGCIRFEVSDQEIHDNWNRNALLSYSDLNLAGSILTGKSSGANKYVHEVRDKSLDATKQYFGESSGLAFLLAYIHRSKNCLWGIDSLDRDIWCTGSIVVPRTGEPMLKAVHHDQFKTKLSAFIKDNSKDKLFIVPYDNIDYAGQGKVKQKCDQYDVLIKHVDDIKQIPVEELFSIKTIIQVQANELEKLTKFIFSNFFDKLYTLKERAERITLSTLRNLKGGAHTYSPDMYVAPAGWNEFIKRYSSSDRPGLIITAPSGTGKTCLLCAMADKDSETSILHDLVHPYRNLLFWNYVNAPRNLSDEILSLIQAETQEEANEFFMSLKEKGGKVFFLIDGINQHVHADELFKSTSGFIQEIKKGGWGETVKVIVSMRNDVVHKYYRHIAALSDHFYFERVPSFLKAADSWGCEIVDIKPLIENNEAHIYSKYRDRFNKEVPEYDELPTPVKKVLHLPLMIRILFESVTDVKEFTSVTEDVLLESYLEHHISKCLDISNDLTIRLIIKNISEYRYLYPQKNLNALEITSWFEKKQLLTGFLTIFDHLCNEGFLRKSEGHTFDFNYEKILEYLLFKYVFKGHAGDDIDSLLTEIAKKPDHPWIVNPFKKFLEVVLFQTADINIEETVRKIINNAGDVGLTALACILGDQMGSLQDQYQAHTDAIMQVIENLEDHNLDKIFDILKQYYFDLIPVPENKYAKNGVKGGKKDNIWEKQYNRYLKGKPDPIRFSNAAVWYADALYNRADKYDDAIEILKSAEEFLNRQFRKIRKNDPNYDKVEKKIYEVRYQLASIYSDYGDNDSAKKLWELCQMFYEDRKDRSTEYLLGYAKTLFLNYMLTGDAAGKFQDSISDLDGAGDIFNKMKDKKSYGRYLVNKAVAILFTNNNFNIEDNACAQNEAMKICDQAIKHCGAEPEDLQGKACALLNKAAINIQKANLAKEDDRISIKEKAIKEAEIALNDAKKIFSKTYEVYIQHLILANEAAICHLQNDFNSAILKFEEIKKQAESETDDFFNEIDASLDLIYIEAGKINVDEKIDAIEKLIEAAHKNKYTQAELRGHWYIWKLSYDYKVLNSETHSRRAKEIAKELKWGFDYKQAIYTPWYAGIFL